MSKHNLELFNKLSQREGWSVKDVSKRSGVARGVVYYLSVDESKNLSKATCYALNKLFGILNFPDSEKFIAEGKSSLKRHFPKEPTPKYSLGDWVEDDRGEKCQIRAILNPLPNEGTHRYEVLMYTEVNSENVIVLYEAELHPIGTLEKYAKNRRDKYNANSTKDIIEESVDESVEESIGKPTSTKETLEHCIDEENIGGLLRRIDKFKDCESMEKTGNAPLLTFSKEEKIKSAINAFLHNIIDIMLG